MTSSTGFYSLIRFCPDPSRQEFVNIGVALYSPATKLVRTTFASDNRRLSQVFSGQDIRLVNRMKKSLEESLKRQSFATHSDFEAYILRNANRVQLSSLRSVKMSDTADTLSQLMERLVEEGSGPRPRIQRALREKLVEAGVEGFVQKQVTINVPNFDQSIRVPYAYQNGRFNLISPVEFSADVRDILSKAGEKAIEGQELYRTPDPSLGELHLVVVAKFDPQMHAHARARVEEIFQEHNVALHSLDNMTQLVQDIRDAAVQHGITN